MSSALTTYGVGLLMRSLFIPDTAVRPASLQLAACFSVPVMNATGDQLDEPPENAGYSRASIDLSSSSWSVSDFGEIYNVVALTVGTPTKEWAPLYGWALVDQNANECVNVGELIDPMEPIVGQATIIPQAGITIGLYG